MSSDPELVAAGEAVDGDELTEEQVDELEEKLEVDYQVGEDLKEKVRRVYPCLVFGGLWSRVNGKQILRGRNWLEIVVQRIGLQFRGKLVPFLRLFSASIPSNSSMSTDRASNHSHHVLGHPSCGRLFHR
jgi:hypothetical protein